MIVFSLIFTVLIVYLILIGYMSYGFDQVNNFRLQDLSSNTQFSIIVPFRNEAEHLPALLKSIADLNYSTTLFEVILVDDASQDNSLKYVEQFMSLQTLQSKTKTIDLKITQSHRSSNSPKKDALNSAIKIAKYEWIVTTDADCILPKYWLDAFDECIQKQHPIGIVAPVIYMDTSSFFNRFQALDMLSLQGVTIGSFGINRPLMCNGANFAYLKSAFTSVGGFEGNLEIASGDDVFLLQKLILKDKKRVVCLKTNKAAVTTHPVTNLSQLIQQRVRWASKTKHSNSGFAKTVGIIVILCNLAVITLVPLLVMNSINPKTALAIVVVKLSIDFLLLFKSARFFKQESVLFSYLLSSFIYPFFNIYILIRTQLRAYNWKGRTFKT